jgi:phenylpyruvate tautomerase PptA (4-oxalocrotonate tautomerase family)
MTKQNMIEFLENAHKEATAVWIEAKASQNWALMAQSYESATHFAKALESAHSNKVGA